MTAVADLPSTARACDPWLSDPAALAEALGTDLERGLSDVEAARRLARGGPNELQPAPKRSAWQRLAAQLRDPLVLLLGAAAAIALAAWWAEGHAGWPVDALVIAAVVAANALIGWAQEAKAESAVAALAKMTAVSSSVLRDGRVQRVPSAALVVGDVLLLAEGDAVGADARLLQSAQLRVQEASLTGESEAVLKDAAVLPAPAPLAERLNMVFKGTAVAQGGGRALVTATGMATEMGAIASLLAATVEPPTPLQKEVARLGRGLGLAALLIAVGVVATLLLATPVQGLAGLVHVLLLGVSLAVAAVPEGLPAILSVVLALGVQRMARRRAVVKRLASVETLGAATVIASDKTGTLTRAEMTIVRTVTASGHTHLEGVGYVPEGAVLHQGRPVQGALREELFVLLGGGSLAGNASLQQGGQGWAVQGDPTEAAFLVAERKLGGHARRQRRFTRLSEMPFTSDRKMMSTLERDHERGGAPMLVAKGAPDVLLGRCTHERVGLALRPLDDARRAAIAAEVAALSDDALRTLAVAYRPLAGHERPADHADLEHTLVWVGTVGIIDPPRAEAAAAIAEARRAGIRVIMITGDHPRTAARIAADLGLAPAGQAVLSGDELDALDDAALAQAVRRTAVYARVAPRHKLRIVAALQAGGEVVAMTGDGVNDAPALKAADIGVAMGITGTEVAKQAARMVLADDDFATIVHAVREGRGVFDNIRKCLRYLLSSNLGEVLTVFGGVVGASLLGLAGAGPGGAVALPLLATQILWINLVTDAGPALALGVDPVADDVMARAPRRAGERVIDARMWTTVLETGVVMALLTLATLDLFLPGGLMEGHASLDQARTAAFTTLVLAQLFNCLNARSAQASAARQLFANPWLWATLVLSLGLQVAVVHVGWLNAAFGTVPLSAAQWAACVAMAAGVLAWGEARKALARWRPAV